MKIFVTGGTGSIGAHLVKKLSSEGHTVHALVRSIEKGKNILFDKVQLFKGDILDKKSINDAMRGCQQVYHLAAYAKVWAKNTGDFYKFNVAGTVNILNSARLNEVEKVVVTSTAGVMGPSISGIINEEKTRDIDLFNEYEGSKAMAESRIKDFVISNKLNVVIVSPSRVYGPFLFGKPSSVTLMVDKFVNGGWRFYPGTGKEAGNYVYIMDVVDGHILAMSRGRTGETYLLGGENHDYVSFYSTLSEASNIKRKMIKIPMWVQMGFAKLQLFLANNFGKEPIVTPKWVVKAKYDWELSSSKAITELGLKVTPLKEGLEKTVIYVKGLK